MFSEHCVTFWYGLESTGVDFCACVDEESLIRSFRDEGRVASYQSAPCSSAPICQTMTGPFRAQSRLKITTTHTQHTHNTLNQPSQDRKNEVVAHVISSRCEELQAASPLPEAANPTEAGSMCQQQPSGRATSFHRHFHMQTLGCMSVLSFFVL